MQDVQDVQLAIVLHELHELHMGMSGKLPLAKNHGFDIVRSLALPERD